MNYKLILAGDGGQIEDLDIGIYFREPFERPRLGQELEYKGKTYRIIKTLPINNPDNVTVTYWLEPLNPNRPYKPTKRKSQQGGQNYNKNV